MIYLKQIQETHKRKVSFWPKYDLSLEKHIAKEKKHKYTRHFGFFANCKHKTLND